MRYSDTDHFRKRIYFRKVTEELTHWKRLWCWEGLGAGGEGGDRGRDGWMASPTRWTWVWVNSGSWWWTGRPGVLQFMGSQRVRHDWATELNWTELVVLWLRFSLPKQGVQVWSLVGELRPHMACGQKTKNNRSNIVTNSIDFKMVHIKKNLKRKN